MDLGAYIQISDLESIAEANNIKVPRLRGYRLMANEKPVNINDIKNDKSIDIRCASNLCEAEPFWDPNSYCSSLSELTRMYKEYYLKKGNSGSKYDPYVGIRWDRIHGRMRRTLKTYIHNERERSIRQYKIWNKYVGREDILYIHARIGGGNWPYYHGEVDNQPWFLEKVDDNFDCTYCDIYAKIDPETLKILNEEPKDEEASGEDNNENS